MTQNEYDDLLDALNAAEYSENKARRAVLAADTEESRAVWNSAKSVVAERRIAVKLAAESL